MRCYFNLVSSHHTITDAEGLEVADVDEARSFAREAAAEMVQDGVAEIAHCVDGRWRPETPPEPSCSQLASRPCSRQRPKRPRLPRRRMGPTLTTRRLDRTGMWPVGTTDCA